MTAPYRLLWRTAPIALAVTIVVILAGCGSSSTTSGAAGGPSTASSTPASTTGSSSAPAAPTPAVADLAGAQRPDAAGFPPARGRTLRQLAAAAASGASLGPATGTFVPGRQRFAFALLSSAGAFIYAPTVVYIGRNPDAPAAGPFPAPADPLTVPPPYRSRQNAGPNGLRAIYAAHLPLPRPGTFTVLTLTRGRSGLIGATGEIAVAASSPIPAVGSRAPAVATDTPASVAGRLSLLTTRIPPDDMHSVSLTQVLGREPVALLFSTPQLCVSRVCAPITDIAVALERRYGRRIAFIHEEVYVNNQPSQGLRPQMKAFHLRTEPWLFAIDRRGIIVARLEGSFGVGAFTQALEAAAR